MRVAVSIGFLVQQTAPLTQHADDDRVRLLDLQSPHKWNIAVETAVVADRTGHRQPVSLADGKVLLTVSGRGVHSSRACIQRDVLAQDDGNLT